ncbi:MAG: penicillin-binding protein [Pseudoalteromonas distincta]|jgi:hypothetical protein|tara:strand:+ start:38289 stop:38510 length:222 start_codon:yes stop_codon:yes gene_type:complete
MSDKMSDDALTALKIAFTYMPKPMDVNRFDHGEDYQRVLADIEQVREMLLLNDIDPDEVDGELRPDSTPNSCY